MLCQSGGRKRHLQVRVLYRTAMRATSGASKNAKTPSISSWPMVFNDAFMLLFCQLVQGEVLCCVAVSGV